MCRIVPRVQQTDGNGFSSARSHLSGDVRRLNGIEWNMNFAGSKQPLLNLEREVPWNQRFGTFEPDVVRLGPIAAPDFVYIARALRDDEGGPGALTFQNGVDRNRGSMH